MKNKKHEITLFIKPPSFCGCGGGNPEMDMAFVKASEFIRKLKENFDEGKVEIKAITMDSAEIGKYPEMKKLKASKKFKAPVVLVDGKIRFIGRYPNEKEIKNLR